MKNNNKTRKSQKGTWGIVGAPPKKTSWLSGPFTMAQLFLRNSKGVNAQCELSLRTKVDARLADGSLVALKTRKQKGGKVGRPKAVFILADKFNAKKHVKLDAVVTKKVRTVVSVTSEPTVSPTVAPVIPTTAPVVVMATIEAPAAPVVNVPVETVTTVEAPVINVDTAAAPAAEPTIG